MPCMCEQEFGDDLGVPGALDSQLTGCCQDDENGLSSGPHLLSVSADYTAALTEFDSLKPLYGARA